MPASGFFSDTGSALATLSQPRDSWDKRYQAMQMNQQYLNIQEARATQQAKEVELGVQKQIQNVNALKAMPVESPDRPKTESYINGLLNDIVKNIKDNYNDDYAKFMLNEGESAIMKMRDSYLSSGVYASATRNKMEMDLARKAIADNQALIGSMDKNGNYVSAEQSIMDFQNGITDGYRHRGAYDASKIKPYEFFSKQYNPGGSKFVPSEVADQDKLSFAQSAVGAEAGFDYYNKALKGRKIMYKTDQIEDRQLFDLDKASKRANINQSNASAANSYASAAKSRAEMLEKKDEAVSNKSYLDIQARENMGSVSASGYNPASPSARKVINGLGISVGDLATTSVGGKPNIQMVQKSNLKGDDFANQIVGITKGQKNGQPIYAGKLKDVLLLDQGGEYYDISKMKQSVVSTDPSIYVDAKEDQASALQNRKPGRAFKKYEVLVMKDDFEKKYPGAAPPGELVKNKETKIDGATKKKDYYRVTGYTPVPNWYGNNEVNQALTKPEVGQKITNQIFNSTDVDIPTFD